MERKNIKMYINYRTDFSQNLNVCTQNSPLLLKSKYYPNLMAFNFLNLRKK